MDGTADRVVTPAPDLRVDWNVDLAQPDGSEQPPPGQPPAQPDNVTATSAPVDGPTAAGDAFETPALTLTDDYAPGTHSREGTQWENDADGNQVRVEMQNGWSFTRNPDGTYDGRGPGGENLSGLMNLEILENGAVTYTRDKGHGISDNVFIRPDGQQLTATYDANGRLIAVTMPGDKQQTFVRDEDGTFTRSWIAPDGKRYEEGLVKYVQVDGNGTVQWITTNYDASEVRLRSVTLDGQDDGGKLVRR